MITAQEARELSGPSAQEYLEFIEQRIRKAAENKALETVIRERPYCDWLYSEKDLPSEPRKALEALRENGFSVTLYYYEGQFVDIGLRISWEEAQ